MWPKKLQWHRWAGTTSPNWMVRGWTCLVQTLSWGIWVLHRKCTIQWRRHYRRLSNLYIQDRAISSPSKRSESRLWEPKAPKYGWNNHHEPYSIYRCLSPVIHLFPPARPRKGVISCESEYNSRSIDSLSSTGDKLQGALKGSALTQG